MLLLFIKIKVLSSFFFFFQAEDGIRDYKVTGVQTCALPILKLVARALRDGGVEVIYTGLHQTPEQIVETAIQEDVDAVGISILSGAHMTLVPRIVALLREREMDVPVLVGGTIPGDDIAELKAGGVA